jgi:hypothetical protein
MQKFISRRILLPFAMAALVSANAVDAATGTLNLTINGVPDNGTVFARNAQGILKRLIEGANTLITGKYVIVVGKIRRPGATVDHVIAGSARPASVTMLAGKITNDTITYAYSRGSGRLWVPVRTNGQAQDFHRTQVATDTSSNGSVIIIGTGAGPISTAFDRSGNLLVASCSDNKLLKYNALTLKSGSAPANVTISANANDSLNCPVGLAFDRVGNLWVGNFGNSTLVKFTAGQRLASGSPTPTVTISANAAGSLNKPYGQAFDAKGKLWVANNAGDNVLGFTPAQLAATGTPTLTLKTPVIDPARSPAFAADGRMWVSSRTGNKVLAFSFGAAGQPTLAATVNLQDVNTAARDLMGRASPAPFVCLKAVRSKNECDPLH